MAEQHPPSVSNQELAGLVTSLLARVERLEAENRHLQAERAPSPQEASASHEAGPPAIGQPTPQPTRVGSFRGAGANPTAGPSAGPTVTRRALLTVGAGSALSAVALAAATATPAAAANGNNITAGATTTAESPTVLQLDGSPTNTPLIFLANDTNIAATTSAYSAAVAGWAGIGGVTSIRNGMYGYSGDGNGWGLVALNGGAKNFTGNGGAILATANGTGATGVKVTSSGTGISVVVNGQRAVDASSSGSQPTVVAANSGGGNGVYGESLSGVAGLFLSDHAQLLLLSEDKSLPAPLGSNNRVGGELLRDGNGNLWFCVAGGTGASTWRKLAGPTSAGAFHLLPSPVRVYDSRPGFVPAVGTKAPLAAGVARAIDLTANSSHVPPGAVAALVSCLVVNATPGNGNLTIWANLAPRPGTNNMVWGGPYGRASNMTVTGLDAAGSCQVQASIPTDFVLDVLGYYQ